MMDETEVIVSDELDSKKKYVAVKEVEGMDFRSVVGGTQMKMNTVAYKPDEQDSKKKYVAVNMDPPPVKTVYTTQTEEEKKLLSCYRALDEKRREKLLTYAEFLTTPEEKS